MILRKDKEMVRRKKSLVKRVLRRMVKKVARRIRNKKLWKRGKRTVRLNRAHSQRGGFSL